RHRDHLRLGTLRDILQVERQESCIEPESGRAIEKLGVNSVAVNGKATGNVLGDPLVVRVGRWELSDGVAEVRDEGPVRRPVPEPAVVAVANRLRDEIHLEVIEGGPVSVLNTNSNEVDDVRDRVVIELGLFVEHMRVLNERTDACLDVDGNVNAADQ